MGVEEASALPGEPAGATGHCRTVSTLAERVVGKAEHTASRHETVGPSIRGMNGELARHSEGRELDLWIETFLSLHSDHTLQPNGRP